MAVWETVLGGALATFGGVVVMYFERKANKRDREQMTSEIRSAHAFSICFKLRQYSGWQSKIHEQIDECFKSAEGQYGDLEPAIKVLPIVMPSTIPEAFSMEELTLAFQTQDAGLVGRLLDAQLCFFSFLQALGEFNVLRKEHTSFVQATSVHGEFLDGQTASIELPASLKHAHEGRIAQLNNLIGQLLETRERDLQTYHVALNRFRSSIVSIDGVRVPNI